MPEILAVLAVTAGVGALCWFAAQSRYEFIITIDGGVARTTRGKVTANFFRQVAEACRRNGVERGWVGGVRKGKRIALVFSGHFPKNCQQQIRNEWVMTP